MQARSVSVLTWAGAFIGAGLVVAAIKNLNPIEELTAALTGRAPMRAGITTAKVTSSGTSQAGTSAAASSGVPELAPLPGHAGHRLVPEAVAAFGAWERAFGQAIPITDSYRDYATQAAGHSADPNRFVDPTRSAHVKGKAVDVNLAALGIKSTADALFRTLKSTAEANGWCFSAIDKKPTPEPWHASWGGCA